MKKRKGHFRIFKNEIVKDKNDYLLLNKLINRVEKEKKNRLKDFNKLLVVFSLKRKKVRNMNKCYL